MYLLHFELLLIAGSVGAFGNGLALGRRGGGLFHFNVRHSCCCLVVICDVVDVGDGGGKDESRFGNRGLRRELSRGGGEWCSGGVLKTVVGGQQPWRCKDDNG